jgi:hypothetical protein
MPTPRGRLEQTLATSSPSILASGLVLMALASCAHHPPPPAAAPIPDTATGRMAQAVHTCRASGMSANDCLMIALGTPDFRAAVTECPAISGDPSNPDVQLPCIKMFVNALLWTPPPAPPPPQLNIVQQPAVTAPSQVVLPGQVTMPIQRGSIPGTYYVPTPQGPRWFSVAPLP